MADMKLSCPECGQHISCNDAWAGQQIECPACHVPIVVPQIPASSITATVPPASLNEPSKVAGPRLSAGVTQVARSTAHATAPLKKIIPRRPRSNNSLLGYAILVVVIAAVAGVGYFYGLPMVKDAVQQAPNSGPPEGAGTSQSGGSRGGAMGDVNDAMDVSVSLDRGSTPGSRPMPATTNPPRPQSTSPRR